jgi:hypothetical protein
MNPCAGASCFGLAAVRAARPQPRVPPTRAPPDTGRPQVLRLDGNRLALLDEAAALAHLQELQAKARGCGKGGASAPQEGAEAPRPVGRWVASVAAATPTAGCHPLPSPPLPMAQNNCLAEAPPVASLPRLRRLYLDANCLRSAAPQAAAAAAASGALHTLSLAHNQIESLEAPAAGGVCGLGSSSDAEPAAAQCGGGGGPGRPPGREHFPLAGRRPCIGGGGGGVAAWWGPGLEELRLAGNRLTSLRELEGCARLRVLDVGRNRLTSLEVGPPLID